MMKKMKALLTEEQGQGMTEYGLVLGVIAIGVVGVLITFRGKIEELFTKATTAVTNAGN
ncbi:Flp family type IVb pilin [Neobacillus notoginsengisoli]|uniref:Flp family type IVb pilin n=1 Tax=Neobacillus notoginsengisoli TaxID=1578198 RepID=A0A417YZ21_9BACI|nr:Flp family type IVb pilin [Neobacillus notoginsengisoli]RHW43169.1 Flp family type IVb pilin [Neobacillus notoginsengisoli]